MGCVGILRHQKMDDEKESPESTTVADGNVNITWRNYRYSLWRLPSNCKNTNGRTEIDEVDVMFITARHTSPEGERQAPDALSKTVEVKKFPEDRSDGFDEDYSTGALKKWEREGRQKWVTPKKNQSCRLDAVLWMWTMRTSKMKRRREKCKISK